MIELEPDYIKKYRADLANEVEITIIVEEDYDPETDGYHCDLIRSLRPLSMPQDNSGTSDIDRIMFCLQEVVKPHLLEPGTIYTIMLVECYEEDGWPHMMQMWAVQEVATCSLYSEVES